MDNQTSLSGSDLLGGVRHSEFEELQQKLIPLWQQIGGGPGGPIQVDNTTVVIPSMTFDVDVPSSLFHAYEERLLFLLFLLRQPNIRLIYVTSRPIQQAVIDYYLDILPGIVYSNARKRLFLVSVEDSTSEPLSKKLLDRPHVMARIRSLIPDLNLAHMVPFNTTDLERRLALALGIPMFAADPAYYDFGTKSGSRRIFQEENILHPLGHNDLFTEEALVRAICQMRAEKAGLEKVIVKLNDSVSGMGNATIDLQALDKPGTRAEPKLVAAALQAMQFEMPGVSYDSYMSAVQEGGAIVEELISGRVIRSPSAQLRITPPGDVELLSTHDQILGGPTGQSYLGARFPADVAYAWTIMEPARKIGYRLVREGVLGRFGVDFVVVQADNSRWQPYAIEINLRKGGTTAPHLTLQYLTDGRYNAKEGVFDTVRGDRKCYVTSDHVESDAYRVFTPDLLFDIVSRHQLHYNHTSQTGIVLHLLSNVGGSGQFGVTAIADSHQEADALYERFLDVVNREALALAGYADGRD